MSSEPAGDRLVPAVLEGLGLFAVGFLGSEALFAPGADGVPLAATVLPAVAAGATAFAYRMRNPLGEGAGGAEQAASPADIHRLDPQPRATAPTPRREAA